MEQKTYNHDELNAEEIVYKPTTRPSKRKANYQNFKNEVDSKSSECGFLYFTAFVANLLAFAAGLAASWSSPVFPKLERPETPLNAPIGTLQKSLVAASLCVGQIVGPFVFGDLSETIGRKKTLILIALPMTVGLTILAFATDVRLYYLARFLHGVGVGGCIAVLNTYIAEISEQHNRGKFSCIHAIFLSLGILYPYIIGNFVTVQVLSLSCLIPLIIFFALFPIFLPDSPLYLVKVNKTELAEKALRKLRNKSYTAIQREIGQIQEFVDMNKHERRNYVEILRSKKLRKPLLIGIGLTVSQQFSGTGVVIAFMNTIFLESGNLIPAEYGSMIVGSIKVLIVFVTSSVVERLGRRFLLLASCLGCASANGCLGLYFFLKTSHPHIVTHLSWLPLVCLMVFVLSFNLGLGSVVWVVLGEIFPSNVRSTALAIVIGMCFSSTTFIIFIFPILTEYFGMAGSFMIFSGCCVVSFAFIYLVVPETKGKSFAEIQKLFSQ